MSPTSKAGDQTLRVTVSKIIDEGGGVRTFRLDLPEGRTFEFRAGQFVRVAFPNAPDVGRIYSLASSPLEKSSIEITLGRVGEFSERLLRLEGGEELLISEAQGNWHFHDDDRNAVLISVNTGIAPLKSMIKYVLDKGLPIKLSLFYAERRPSTILYKKELDEFGVQGVEIHTTLTETDRVAEDGMWEGPTGPITIKDIRKKVKDFKSAAYYVCGPNKFIDDISAALQKAGVPEESIRGSKWGDF